MWLSINEIRVYIVINNSLKDFSDYRNDRDGSIICWTVMFTYILMHWSHRGTFLFTSKNSAYYRLIKSRDK